MSLSLQNKKARVFSLALVFVSGFFLRFRTPLEAEEKMILPDSVEYSVSAVNLLEGKGYTLAINGKSYPPRYPFGYPLTLIPCYLLFGESLGNGIFATLFFSMMSLFFLYFLSRNLFGEEVAFWSVLFLAVSPLHLYWSRHIMADVPFAFFILLGFWLFFRGAVTAGKSFLLGFLVGISILFKYTGLLFLPLFSLFLWRGGRSLRKRFALEGLFLCGTLLSAFPLLLYHHFAFGHFFRTSLSFWTPEWLHFENLFSLSYALEGPRLPVGATPNLPAFSRFLLGVVAPWHQNPYPFFMVPLVGLGIWKVLKEYPSEKEFLFFTLVAVAWFYGFFAFYFAQNMRYLLPVIPPILILGAAGWHSLFRTFPERGQKILFFLLAGFLVSSPPLLWKSDQHPPLKRSYVDLIRHRTENDASIITGWDPVLFYHRLQRDSKRRYLPLSKDLEYVHEPFPPDPKRTIPFLVVEKDPEAVMHLVRTQKPVYLDSESCKNHPGICEDLAARLEFEEVDFREGISLYRLRERGEER